VIADIRSLLARLALVWLLPASRFMGFNALRELGPITGETQPSLLVGLASR
jgi:hypothetical protein